MSAAHAILHSLLEILLFQIDYCQAFIPLTCDIFYLFIFITEVYARMLDPCLKV